MQYHICRYKYSCILGYPTGYSQPNTPIKWNAKKCGADIIVVRHGEPLPDSRTDISGSSCPPSPTTGAGARKPKVRQSPESDAARRRARQSIREYELNWLLQQRLRAVCSVLASLAFALHAATAWPRHGRWELSDLDHSHAATPQRATRASCVQLLSSVLGAACR